MLKLKKLFLLSLVIPIIFLSSIAYAKPFCALRDPTVEVYELFPLATSYKSIVHTVGKGTRSKILDILPFTIHAKEIGEHTVYAAFSDERSLGLVHVRSELGSWGLLEIAWAIDLDGNVIDFTFQRCREDGCKEIGSLNFRQQLLGMGLTDLTALMNEDGSELLEGKLMVTPGAMELGASVIRSAMKTLVVTQMVWGDDIEVLKTYSPLTIMFNK
ncbi:MAG: hypothetical protein ACKE9I_01570 [Methylophagaceae bacterium]